ncbi:MAG: OPT/YSL family transporter, partial [Acidobacteriota bacterium]
PRPKPWSEATWRRAIVRARTRTRTRGVPCTLWRPKNRRRGVAMEHSENGAIAGLPKNARRPLEPGEVYVPVVPTETGVFEVTGRSVFMGLIFCALFSMAAAYLALRVGQGIEAAIPIAILAIGLSPLFARRSTILENVIVQSIGANSSHVVAGAVFTIPALYMLAADPASDRDPAVGRESRRSGQDPRSGGGPRSGL